MSRQATLDDAWSRRQDVPTVSPNHDRAERGLPSPFSNGSEDRAETAEVIARLHTWRGKDTMLAIHTILHPTDFSDRSEFAFRLACALARDYEARLILLHVMTSPVIVYGEGVVPPLSLEDDRERWEEELHRLGASDPSIHVEHRLEEGDSVTQILAVAKETSADLVVIGTHGRTGLSRLLMGSVAEQVVRKAPCPVLTVRTPFHEAVPSHEAVAESAVIEVPSRSYTRHGEG